MTRPFRLLDLANLPRIPGFLSDADRNKRLTLRFLHSFAKAIVQPVERNDRTNVDYVPTQVFTEFLRDYPFRDGGIDGLRYRSATGLKGANVVLFAEPKDVEGACEPTPYSRAAPWLRLVKVSHRKAAVGDP